MEQQPNNIDRLKVITDSIERGIQELFESDKYKQYLRTMSRFHNYSLNNTMLISMQRPDATLVAGFNKWRNQLGRTVKRGEKSIKIIAPTPYKVKREQEKLDPDTKAPMRDADGKIVIPSLSANRRGAGRMSKGGRKPFILTLDKRSPARAIPALQAPKESVRRTLGRWRDTPSALRPCGAVAAPEWERSKGFGGIATNKQKQGCVQPCPACRIDYSGSV